MMNIKEIKELIEAVSKYGVDDFYFENKDLKIEIKNNRPVITSYNQNISSHESTPVAPVIVPLKQQAESKNSTPIPDAEEERLIPIKSPIVGTFYRSPNPSAPPFVEVGSEVKQNSTACIVEAMKVMNEIKANCHGKIVQVLVQDGQPVEYEQVLMYVKPL